MASAILKRDKLVRLMYCLSRSCTKVTKSLVLHYLSLARPSNIKDQEWNIDEFLNVHRDGFILHKFNKDEYRKKVLFPGLNKHTNTNDWDLATLFTVLGLFQNVNRDIRDEMNNMRTIRNTLFHWGSKEMTDADFGKNKENIEQFVEKCCRVIGNDSIKEEVTVILEDTEEVESIEHDLHTELERWKKNDILDILDKREPVIVSTLEEIYMKVGDIFGIEVQEMPEIKLTLNVNNCGKETSEKATEILNQNLQISPPECGPKDRKLWNAIQVAKQKLLCEERKLRETCKACVILTVQCPDFNSLKSLLEECRTGKLTAAWKSVENILRHMYENDELTLEFTISNSDFWCCIEELVEKVTKAVHKQVGVDISPHLSPAIMMHPPSAQRDGKGSGTVSAVPITIKPKSYRHALEVSDVIKSGSLDEDFRMISTLLADIYGMNDVTITANLEITETGNVVTHHHSILNMYVKEKQEIDVKSDEVYGGTFMSDGQLVLACGHEGLKLFNKDFKFTSRSSFPAVDVSVIYDSDVIITQGGLKQLQRVRVFPYMEVKKTYKMDRSCIGVDVYGDEIYVTCHDCPGNGEVLVLNMYGEVQRRLGVDNGTYMFTLPTNVKVNRDASKVFVSDGSTYIVTCLNSHGRVLYEYSDKDLKKPHGMYVDGDDNLLVCGFHSNNVHVIRPDGGKEKMLLSEKDGIHYPVCISYRQSDGCLAVGLHKNGKTNKNMIVFKTR